MEATTAKLEISQYALAKGVSDDWGEQSTSRNPPGAIIQRIGPVAVEVIWESLRGFQTAELPANPVLSQRMSGVKFRTVNRFELRERKQSKDPMNNTREYFRLVEELGDLSPEQVDRLARESAWNRYRNYF